MPHSTNCRCDLLCYELLDTPQPVFDGDCPHRTPELMPTLVAGIFLGSTAA